MTVFNFVRNCLIVCAFVTVFEGQVCNAFTQDLCEKACSLSDWLCWFCDEDVLEINEAIGMKLIATFITILHYIFSFSRRSKRN